MTLNKYFLISIALLCLLLIYSCGGDESSDDDFISDGDDSTDENETDGDASESSSETDTETAPDGDKGQEYLCDPGWWTCFDEYTAGLCDEYGSGYVEHKQCGLDEICYQGDCIPRDEYPEDGDIDEDTYEDDVDYGPEFSQCNGDTNTALINCLHNAIDNHNSLGYDGARNAMFLDIDNEDDRVRCVYTGTWVDVPGPVLPSSTLMNTEHTWPQSLGAGSGDPRADLHHLFPTLSDINGCRGHEPFGYVVDNVSDSSICVPGGGSMKGDDKYDSTVFEVRDDHKGDTARAIFYMAVRYDWDISAHQEEAMRLWNDFDPPDDYEEARNGRIEDYQYNRNPFVDRPDFIDRISDF